MVQEIKTREGYWLSNYHKDEIGSWDFIKEITWDDIWIPLEEMQDRWREITDSEKIEKEKEQQDWWDKQNNNDE